MPEASSQPGTAARALAENNSYCPMAVGGLQPEVWAGLFRQQQHLLDPVLPWLHQRLVGIYWDEWWLVEAAESSILNSLCMHGPVAEVLIQRLQHFLHEHTGPLVHSVISIIESWCSERALGLLHSHTDRDEYGDSEATSISSFGSSSCRWDLAEPHSSPSHLQSVPIPAEQTQPQEEPEQQVAKGSSAQGSSCSPSTPSQGRNHLLGRPRHPPKRRDSRPPDTPQPSEKISQQQHKQGWSKSS
ncbi:hypothetical protein BTVI_42644 [Pitangus sulphuratus]|nr:hypothetical protein BTVI_42644 [Pitangus sulphuratus]